MHLNKNSRQLFVFNSKHNLLNIPTVKAVQMMWWLMV